MRACWPHMIPVPRHGDLSDKKAVLLTRTVTRVSVFLSEQQPSSNQRVSKGLSKSTLLSSHDASPRLSYLWDCITTSTECSHTSRVCSPEAPLMQAFTHNHKHQIRGKYPGSKVSLENRYQRSSPAHNHISSEHRKLRHITKCPHRPQHHNIPRSFLQRGPYFHSRGR